MYGNVLIVDEDVSVRGKISDFLEEKGYSCKGVSNAKDALKEIQEGKYDLIIWDLRLPGLNGMEILKNLKKWDMNIPVILTSTLKDINSVRVALKEGAVDYITKPIHYHDLENSVKFSLEKKKLKELEKQFKERLEREIERQKKKIHDQYLHGIIGLIKIIEERDQYTKGHSQRVSELAVKIAANIGMDNVMVTKVKIAGLLHDIGIIAIPDSILKKSGALNKEEMSIVRKHPVIGVELLSYFISDNKILSIVRHHHERWDGKGYPDGLEGNAIPLGSRILAVADSYDAMTFPRPYREIFSKEAAIKELEKHSGSQFDREVVEKAVKIINTQA